MGRLSGPGRAGPGRSESCDGPGRAETFYQKLKNVSSEYDRLNGRNSTLQAETLKN